jgi:hypothetical protein
MDILIKDDVKYFRPTSMEKNLNLKKLSFLSINIFLGVILFCLQRKKF